MPENTILTPQVISNELLMRTQTELTFASSVHMEYDERFAKSGGKIGDTINARVPVKFTASDGAVLDEQAVEERSVPITIDTQKHVAFSFTSKDLTLSIDRFSERYLKSAAIALANAIDVDGLTMAYKNTYNFVGVPGTVPTALKTYHTAGMWLDNMGCPPDDQRTMLINPKMNVEIIDALKGLFNDPGAIGRQYMKGYMGKAIGFTWKNDPNIRTHTTGVVVSGTPLVQGASQTGSSIITDGWNSGATTLKEGDVVGFAGCYAVHPVSGDAYADLARFVVTSDQSDSGGAITIPIEGSNGEGLTVSGPYKNASAAPGNNAAVYVFDTTTVADVSAKSSPQGLAFHKQAFGVASVPMEIPQGVHFSAKSTDQETGMSSRIISDYNINNDRFVTRCDVLYGWAPLIREFAVRICA